MKHEECSGCWRSTEIRQRVEIPAGELLDEMKTGRARRTTPAIYRRGACRYRGTHCAYDLE